MWTSRHRTWDEFFGISFFLTRAFVTCLGVFLLFVILVSTCELVAYYRPSPPPRAVEEENAEVVSRGCFAPRRPPLLDYAFLLGLSALPVLAMALVWRQPRAGFLMAGAGVALLVAAFRVRILVEMGTEELRASFGWPQDTFILSLLSWLAFAWWKVGPAGPHEPFRGPLALESAPPKC